MNKILKKSLISFGAILPISLSAITLTSCHANSKIPDLAIISPELQSWKDFQASVKRDTAKNIIMGSGMKAWQDYSLSQLTLGAFNVTNHNKTITTVISNSLYNLKTNFSIKYHNVEYNNNQWKYNNNLKPEFNKNASLPSDLLISEIVQINNSLYVGSKNNGINNTCGLWISNDHGKTFSQNKYFSKSSISLIKQIDNTIYVVAVNTYTDSNFLWTSNDNGKTFSVNKDLESLVVTQITKIDDIIYVGAEKEYTNISNCLWTSKDNGKTFVQNTTFSSKGISQITKINNIIYILDNEGSLWESNNNSKTFSVNKYLESLVVTQITKIDDTIYVLTDWNGLWASTDHGKTFVQNTTFLNANEQVTQIAKIDDKIYVGVLQISDFDNDYAYLWISNDHGKSFSLIPNFKNESQISQIIKIDNILYIVCQGIGEFMPKHSLYTSIDSKTFFSNAFFSNTLISQIIEIDHTIYFVVSSSKSKNNIYQN